jgi:hypothetical protein
MAGWLWLLRHGCEEDEARARYALASSQSSWDLDVWVAPGQRGSLVFARLWEEANAVLHAQGVRWSCSRISRFNPASLAAHARWARTGWARPPFSAAGAGNGWPPACRPTCTCRAIPATCPAGLRHVDPAALPFPGADMPHLEAVKHTSLTPPLGLNGRVLEAHTPLLGSLPGSIRWP